MVIKALEWGVEGRRRRICGGVNIKTGRPVCYTHAHTYTQCNNTHCYYFIIITVINVVTTVVGWSHDHSHWQIMLAPLVADQEYCTNMLPAEMLPERSFYEF